MSKFVYIYHAPDTPAEAAPPTPEQMSESMKEWYAWAGTVGEGRVDLGNPLGDGVRVTSDRQVVPSSREVVGYSIIDADDLDAAVEFAKVHPHLNMPGGCEIEVHAAQEIPGM